MKKKIKVFGERNTGTNYIEKLIENNLDIEIISGIVPRPFLWLTLGTEKGRDLYFKMFYERTFGWKHSVAPDSEKMAKAGEHIVFIAAFKNPYSWLLSLYKKPYHLGEAKRESFAAFLESPCPTVGRENYGPAFKNPVEMWNIKNRSYLDLQEKANLYPLRYEDLLENPGKVIDDIGDKFSISLRKKGFQNIEKSTKEPGRKNFDFYRNYYLQEEWKKNLDSKALTIINGSLDHDLAKSLGYEVIQTLEGPES